MQAALAHGAGGDRVGGRQRATRRAKARVGGDQFCQVGRLVALADRVDPHAAGADFAAQKVGDAQQGGVEARGLPCGRRQQIPGFGERRGIEEARLGDGGSGIVESASHGERSTPEHEGRAAEGERGVGGEPAPGVRAE